MDQILLGSPVLWWLTLYSSGFSTQHDTQCRRPQEPHSSSTAPTPTSTVVPSQGAAPPQGGSFKILNLSHWKGGFPKRLSWWGRVISTEELITRNCLIQNANGIIGEKYQCRRTLVLIFFWKWHFLYRKFTWKE